jgi:thioredoxin 1
MKPVHLTDKNFKQEVLESEVPVLVDFWAEWCGPCKMIAPLLEEIAQHYHGKVKVAKLDVDEGRVSASKYGIMSIPTLIIFKGGKAIDQIVGALGKKDLVAKINENL